MAGTVNATQLHEGATIKVSGVVQYSRIGSVITGEELIRADKRRTERGAQPVGKDHTSLTLRDPRIIPASGNPNNLSIDELYVQERFYRGTNDTNTYYYNIINRGGYLPNVYARNQENPSKADPVSMDGKELQSGLRVQVLMKVYKPKNYANRGVGIEVILVEDPIRFRDPSSFRTSAALQEMGITVIGEVDQEPNEENTEPAEMPKQADPAKAIPDPAAGNQFNSQPVQPAQEQPWLCVCGHTNPENTNFCPVCGKPKSEAVKPAVGNPYANQAPAGIRFDPNSTDRNY